MTDELQSQQSDAKPQTQESEATQLADQKEQVPEGSASLEQNDTSPPPVRKPKELIQLLSERFPNCFSVNGPAKPLKIGIFNDLVEAFSEQPHISKTLLRSTLRHYTNSWRYLAAVTVGNQRVNLQGEDVETVDASQAEYASTRLQESKAFAKQQRIEKKSKVSAATHQKKGPQDTDATGQSEDPGLVQTSAKDTKKSVHKHSLTKVPTNKDSTKKAPKKRASTNKQQVQQNENQAKHGYSKGKTNLKSSPQSKNQERESLLIAPLEELIPGRSVFMTQGAKPIAATVVERNKNNVTVETVQGFTVRVLAETLRVKQ